MMGMTNLAPLTWHTFWTTWRTAWWWDAAILIATADYLAGLLRLRRRGEHWPWPRLAFFLTGVAVLVISLNTAIDVYAHPLFWIHMIQHLLLIMVIPVLLVAGQPLRLAVTLSGEQSLIARLVRSPAGLLGHPVMAGALYTVVIVGTHLTSFMQLMLTHPVVHQGEKVLYLVSGLLLFWPLVGNEQVRSRVPYFLRLAVLFMAMTVDTFVGLILMLTGSEPFPGYIAMHQSWEPAPISDLHYGGAIMWCGGDALMFLICLVIGAQWITDPNRRDQLGSWLEGVRRAELTGHGETTALDQISDVDNDERARRAYNDLLERLNRAGE
jgi:putative copper resistance protein D